MCRHGLLCRMLRGFLRRILPLAGASRAADWSLPRQLTRTTFLRAWAVGRGGQGLGGQTPGDRTQRSEIGYARALPYSTSRRLHAFSAFGSL